MMSRGDTKSADQQRRHRWLTVTALVAVAAAVATILLAAGTFETDRIHFSGLHRVSYDEAYEAADIRPGDFMGTLDTGGAERSLESLPWVADARVRRRWPATVEVDVVERTPAAVALAAPGSWVLLDIEGRILTSPLTVVPELPRLSGIAAAPEPGAFLASDANALLAALSAAHGQPEFEVAALWRDRRGDLRARVRQQPGDLVLEVALGDDSAIGAKTAAIAAVIGEMTASDAILDVSVPHLPVLRPSG
ncbi:MAG: FtsQ-type POTRA domain-containing protein [Acidimicrobiales bacterium]|nr:FtsQ-type POTRA domain-containing protein [Acidimicrobiales bacterium]MXX42984.1 FtsQ-type POTRA domain-containing protein [Acidimicrobiales bacterium]MXZ16376.1 FtsQ-type POTRA domain-containing protein [Acidimicrobiales bacterium]MYB80975.1 FtsQ-type POTRA domain-containing protein [Acidimicrobiales bacterium]MYD33622.1 FtsQ-type POTRA domain-containing protein [Acidimicrobiales bacterium]